MDQAAQHRIEEDKIQLSHSQRPMEHTEYLQMSPRDPGLSGDGAAGLAGGGKTPRKKKKVGMYYLILDQILGSGTFSRVYLGESEPSHLEMLKKQKRIEQSNDNKFAIKEISNKTLQDKLGPKGQETLKKEVDITKLLNHPNIVRLIDYIRTENNNYLVFEYCGGGDLRGFLKSKSRLTEPVAQRFMRQIGDALKYLYTNNIIHRDLKPQNIMLTEKVETASLKLADFGLAKRYEASDELFETTCGTPIYMAPELQRQEKYTDKADLWSVGVIMFELIVGFPPFVASNREQLKKAIELGKITFPEDVRSKISPCCLDLLKLLLRQDVGTRIDWLEFFSHPFIKSDSKIYAEYYQAHLVELEAQIQLPQAPKMPQSKILATKPPQKQSEEAKDVEEPQKEAEKQQIPLQENQQIMKQSPRVQPEVQKVAEEPKVSPQVENIKNQQDQIDSKPREIPLQELPKLSPREVPKQAQREDLSMEDLMECVEDIITSIEFLIERAKQADYLLDIEIRSITTFKHHDYEGIIKFMIYKLTHELASLLSLFSHKRFAKHLRVPVDTKEFIRNYVMDFTELRDKQSSFKMPQLGTIIRIYTTCPKEINLTEYLMQKLAEDKGMQILALLKDAMQLYLVLSDFLMDFSYVIDELDYISLADDYLDFALELCKESILAETLGDKEKSRKKLSVAAFVADEISFELFNSLKFSNDTQSSSNDTPNESKAPHAQEQLPKIKSFTFDMRQKKITFDRKNEMSLSKLQEIIRLRQK